MGRTLRAAVALYFANFGTIALLVLAIFGPAELLKNFAIAHAGRALSTAETFQANNLVGLIVDALLTPALITALAHRIATAEKLPLGAAIRAGASKWGTIVAVRVITGLRVVVGLIVVVPGVIWAIRYTVIDAIVTLEPNRMALGRAMNRCEEIVVGARLKIAVLGIICVAITLAGTQGFVVAAAHVPGWPVACIADLAGDLLTAFLDVLFLQIYLEQRDALTAR